jgi:hypothetical protein
MSSTTQAIVPSSVQSERSPYVLEDASGARQAQAERRYQAGLDAMLCPAADLSPYIHER